MNELFINKPPTTPLPLAHERLMIYAAKVDPGAQWALLTQYAGALQAAKREVQTRAPRMTPEQLEDLEQDLTLVALEAIQTFNLETHIRLAQTLPTLLSRKAMEMVTALVVPAGTLARWFRVLRHFDGDHALAAEKAPTLGMSSDTFRAIHAALDHSEAEWSTVPYDAGRPTADIETHRLIELAMSLLTPAETEVIELGYGFRGDPKPDDEVALILNSTKGTVKSQRKRSLAKMRAGLTQEVPA